MKLLCFVIISLAFFSCQQPPEGVIKNEATYTVNFTNGRGTYALAPDESMDAITLHDLSLNDFSSVPLLPGRVSYKTEESAGKFFDTVPLEIKIFNTLSKDVNVSHEGYIDEDDNAETVLNVSIIIANEDNPDTPEHENEFHGYIYTNTPRITAKTDDGYPVTFTYLIDSGIMSITLR